VPQSLQILLAAPQRIEHLEDDGAMIVFTEGSEGAVQRRAAAAVERLGGRALVVARRTRHVVFHRMPAPARSDVLTPIKAVRRSRGPGGLGLLGGSLLLPRWRCPRWPGAREFDREGRTGSRPGDEDLDRLARPKLDGIREQALNQMLEP
jgi:hypothetical protein